MCPDEAAAFYAASTKGDQQSAMEAFETLTKRLDRFQLQAEKVIHQHVEGDDTSADTN